MIMTIEKILPVKRLFTAVLLLALVCSSQAFAQPGEDRERDSRLSGNRSHRGLVLALNEPDMEIIINGEAVPFDRERITVRYQGREVDSFMVFPGLNVRYTLGRDGYIRDVFLLSPRDVIEAKLVE